MIHRRWLRLGRIRKLETLPLIVQGSFAKKLDLDRRFRDGVLSPPVLWCGKAATTSDKLDDLGLEGQLSMYVISRIYPSWYSSFDDDALGVVALPE